MEPHLCTGSAWGRRRGGGAPGAGRGGGGGGGERGQAGVGDHGVGEEGSGSYLCADDLVYHPGASAAVCVKCQVVSLVSSFHVLKRARRYFEIRKGSDAAQILVFVEEILNYFVTKYNSEKR